MKRNDIILVVCCVAICAIIGFVGEKKQEKAETTETKLTLEECTTYVGLRIQSAEIEIPFTSIKITENKNIIIEFDGSKLEDDIINAKTNNSRILKDRILKDWDNLVNQLKSLCLTIKELYENNDHNVSVSILIKTENGTGNYLCVTDNVVDYDIVRGVEYWR